MHFLLNLECLILNAAKHEKYDHNLTAVMDTYGTDFGVPAETSAEVDVFALSASARLILKLL